MFNYDELIEALKVLRDEIGRGFQNQVYKETGISNVGRYIRKEKNPSPESWVKLHLAYPDIIPPLSLDPQGPAGVMSSVGDNNRLVKTGTYIENEKRFGPELTELMELYDQYETKANIKRMLNKARKKMREAERY